MKLFLITALFSNAFILGTETTGWEELYEPPITIAKNNLDELVLDGIKHIAKHGERFEARAGNGLQAYDVSYTLLNPLRRVHAIRQPQSIRYFSRELLAYFNGSLKVEEGLAQASSFWKTLADEQGEVCSNYGHYVFHQRIPEQDNITQYEWVIRNLEKNSDSRKAFININQPKHKVYSSKDFPCTLGMQFFIRKDHLCCVVSSRSTDIYTGLPYDMGFFTFVTELVYKDLKERLPQDDAKNLKLGYVTMKSNFTQIYDKTRDDALKLLDHNYADFAIDDTMPPIENAQETLQDIYNKTANTAVMQWIYQNAKIKSSK